MNREALFSDGTGNFLTSPEPDWNQRVRIYFRTAKDDVDYVFLADYFGEYPMQKEYSKGMFDYYSIEYQLGVDEIHYWFRICSGGEIVYYNRYGVMDYRSPQYDFTLIPGFSTPDWAKGAVMYQIYTDRFYNGDKSNDVEDREYYYLGDYSAKITDWDKYPESSMGIREFYGGDLQGVIDKLDYLQDLGVEVLYFNPLFVSPSNHKYDIQDYDYIDPHFGRIVVDEGELLPEECRDNSRAERYKCRVADKRNLEASNQLFVELVEELHRRGMKIILDGVFNHCGSFNKWMDRERIYEGFEGYSPGAYVSKESPYHSFFRFTESDKWPYNNSYDGWWGHETLPKLNYEDSQKLEDYIIEIGKKWVSPPYNVDGWRLDVAADLGYSQEYNHKFWKKFRKAVKEVNPNALILAEHYGDPESWLSGGEWDTVMNYDAFMEPVTWFLTGMEKHSDEYIEEQLGNGPSFVGAMKHHMANMAVPSILTAMNELSNHDHSRFLTRTNHVVGRVAEHGCEKANEGVCKDVMREAVVIQMTWPGSPTVYYGDEAGVCGFTDPDNRRTYPWGKEDQEMIDFHRDMIRIHKEHQVFKTGSVVFLNAEDNVLAYGRFDDKEQVVVILNHDSEYRELEIPVWQAEIGNYNKLKRLVYSYDKGYTVQEDYYLVMNGTVVLNMGPHSAIVMITVD